VSIARIDDRHLDPDTLIQLTKDGPVIVTHDGAPRYVIHPTTPEWMEMLAVEEGEPGDMRLEDYARLYSISLDAESYLREFPEDAPYTTPDADENSDPSSSTDTQLST